DGGQTFTLVRNAMEASILFRADEVRRIGYRLGQGDEHLPLLKGLGDRLDKTEMGIWASYCYRWGCGEWHASGSLSSEQPLDRRPQDWQQHNQDIRPGQVLKPTDMTGWFERWACFVPEDVRPDWLAQARQASKSIASCTY